MVKLPALGSAAPDFQVQDALGDEVARSTLQGRKAVLIFLRHLGCPICRMEIAELRRRGEEFRKAGAEVIVFVDSPQESVASFAKTNDLPFRLVADPRREVYEAYGIERGSILAFVAPGAAARALKATLRGHMHGRFEGSELLLPGDFVLDEAGKILFAHRGAHIGDNTPLDHLLAVARGDATGEGGEGPRLTRRTFLAVGGVGTASILGGAGYYDHAVDAIAELPPDQVAALYEGHSTTLLRRYPGLQGKLPWMPLGTYPTPVEPLAGPGGGKLALEGQGAFYVKRDDLTSPLYGGNKVRKLEHVLAEAKLLGRKQLLTVGGLGSNQCLATAMHGGRLGFEVNVALFDQPVTPHVVANLLADHYHGAQMLYGGGYVGTAVRGLKQYLSLEAGYYIPAGATVPLGNIGYVDAALELAEQVKAGLLPEPDRIFVAAGSCGTAAGLIAGCKLAGLKSRVAAVRITEPIAANAFMIARHANAVVAALRKMDASIPDIHIATGDFDLEPGYYGAGYGVATPEAKKAMALADGVLKLETTYTAKAFAAASDAFVRSRPGETILFWQTLNSADVKQSPSIESLPPALRRAVQAG